MTAPNTDVMCRVSRLSVYFGRGSDRYQAVNSISFDVASGHSYGLVGESGSGKTTVLNAITGRKRNWDGSIIVDGRALGPKRAPDFCRTVQMVFQDPYASLHPRHTVDRTLMETIEHHGIDSPQSRLVAALQTVGLDTSFRFRYPHQLSGGQRQRVAIARTLILEPRMLLLDEPTSALDVSIQAGILNMLKDIRQTHLLTYILVSHNLAVIAFLCDRVGVMKYGEMIEELSADQLARQLANADYTRNLLRAIKGYRRSG